MAAKKKKKVTHRPALKKKPAPQRKAARPRTAAPSSTLTFPTSPTTVVDPNDVQAVHQARKDAERAAAEKGMGTGKVAPGNAGYPVEA